jgi:hypothetical protein
VAPIVGVEVEDVTVMGEPARSRFTGWMDIFDEEGAGFGAVAAPQFIEVDTVISDKVETVVNGVEFVRDAMTGRVDVFNKGSAGFRAVCTP